MLSLIRMVKAGAGKQSLWVVAATVACISTLNQKEWDRVKLREAVLPESPV